MSQLDENMQPIPHLDAIAPLQGRYLGNQEEIRNRIAGVKVSGLLIKCQVSSKQATRAVYVVCCTILYCLGGCCDTSG